MAHFYIRRRVQDYAAWKQVFDVLATSKSGTLLLRRDQGDVAALLDSRRCRL